MTDTQRSGPKSPRRDRNGSGRLGIALLLILTAILVFRNAAAIRAERALHRMSFAELQAESQHDPSNARVFYYLGLRAHQMGQSHLAMSALWHAANLDPDDEKLWLIWSQMAFAVQGRQAARHVLQTFLQVHPQSIPAHLELATLSEEVEDHAGAGQAAQATLTLDPSNAEAWQILGQSALATHDLERAETAFRTAIRLRPRAALNYGGLGDVLFLTARYPEAASAYREKITLSPEDGTAFMALGQTLLKTASAPAEIEAARTSLQQALARPATLTQSGLYYASTYLGQTYEMQSRWKDALPWLQLGERIQPTRPGQNTDVHFGLARVYAALNDPSAAARETALHQNFIAFNSRYNALSAHLYTHPSDTQARLELARLFAAQRDYRDAVKMYSTILASTPNLVVAKQEMAAAARHDAGAP